MGANTYKISRHELVSGVSNMKFHIEDSFFEQYEGSEVIKGECDVNIVINKSLAMIRMDITIEGNVVVDCDRCLEEIEIPIKFNGTLLIKESSEVEDMEFELDDKKEDTIWINPSNDNIDLSQYLFDSINLSLPLQRVHGVDNNGVSLCNPDMLSRFQVATNDTDIENEWSEDFDDDDDFDIEDLLKDEDWDDDDIDEDDE